MVAESGSPAARALWPCLEKVCWKEDELPNDQSNEDKKQMKSNAKNVHLFLLGVSFWRTSFFQREAETNIYALTSCTAIKM
jgi:hypothetical protein